MHSFFGFGSVFMVLFWGLIIYMFVKIALNSKGLHAHKDPIHILKERYAKGEITKEQFESMKKDLS